MSEGGGAAGAAGGAATGTGEGDGASTDGHAPSEHESDDGYGYEAGDGYGDDGSDGFGPNTGYVDLSPESIEATIVGVYEALEAAGGGDAEAARELLKLRRAGLPVGGPGAARLAFAATTGEEAAGLTGADAPSPLDRPALGTPEHAASALAEIRTMSWDERSELEAQAPGLVDELLKLAMQGNDPLADRDARRQARKQGERDAWTRPDRWSPDPEYTETPWRAGR